MIPRADIPNLVLPVAAVEAPTPLVAVADAKQEAFARLTQIAIGQQLQARVLSTYNDGSFLVRIADTAARMVLPTASRTGDSMVLTLIKKDPRPTFLMSEINPQDRESAEVTLSPASRKMQQELQPLKSPLQGEAAQISRGNISESPLNTANQKTEQTLPEGVKTSLSNAGKLVDVLLHTAEDNGAATTIKSTAPLVSNPANTSQLAKALHDSITFSGAFYESHVAAWSNGNRPLTELQKEPQAQLSQQMSSNPADLLKSTDPLGNELGKIINLQLNTLEQQRIVWQGEAWPGQNMDWEISQDNAESQQQEQGEDERTPSWHSVVRFNFANLGSVSASIHLIGQQIHMQVRTDNAMAAAALRSNSNMLSDSMAAAGSTLDSLIVKRDGET